MKINNRLDLKKRRHLRVRNKISGSGKRPRMCVSITNRHMYVQFVDDENSRTIAACSTAQDDGSKHNLETARSLGRRVGEAARASGITQVVFDRGGHAFHGKVKVIADAAREAGIKL